MQDTQLMTEGLALMSLGMGIVFVFLTVLVMVTTLMSKIIGRYFPESAVPVSVQPSAQAAAGAADDDDDLMVVISAAVHRYRQHR